MRVRRARYKGVNGARRVGRGKKESGQMLDGREVGDPSLNRGAISRQPGR